MFSRGRDTSGDFVSGIRSAPALLQDSWSAQVLANAGAGSGWTGHLMSGANSLQE